MRVIGPKAGFKGAKVDVEVEGVFERPEDLAIFLHQTKVVNHPPDTMVFFQENGDPLESPRTSNLVYLLIQHDGHQNIAWIISGIEDIFEEHLVRVHSFFLPVGATIGELYRRWGIRSMATEGPVKTLLTTVSGEFPTADRIISSGDVFVGTRTSAAVERAREMSINLAENFINHETRKWNGNSNFRKQNFEKIWRRTASHTNLGNHEHAGRWIDYDTYYTGQEFPGNPYEWSIGYVNVYSIGGLRSIENMVVENNVTNQLKGMNPTKTYKKLEICKLCGIARVAHPPFHLRVQDPYEAHPGLQKPQGVPGEKVVRLSESGKCYHCKAKCGAAICEFETVLTPPILRIKNKCPACFGK